MFKIQEGFVDYGSDLFGRAHAGRTVSAKSKPHRFTTNETDFFAQRVLRYWNILPPLVKVSESVTGFKRGLDAFRLHGYQANKLGHYWELSYDIFDRIDESVSNRNSNVSSDRIDMRYVNSKHIQNCFTRSDIPEETVHIKVSCKEEY